jgi:hypothetical protein
MRKSVMIALLVIGLIAGSFALSVTKDVQACYTYTLNSDSQGDVILGSQVTVTAYTSNLNVKQVRFIWENPSGQQKIWTISVSSTSHTAVSSYIPDVLGTWKISAQFMNPNQPNCYYDVEYVNVKICDVYALVMNYTDGNVPLGDGVKVTGYTTDANVAKIRFSWYNPSGQKIWTDTVNVYTNTTKFGGKTVEYADSIHKPNVLGNWTVKSEFLSASGSTCCCSQQTIKTKCLSFNVIPEAPLIGTAGASLAMLLGVVYFKRKALVS